MSSAGSDVCIYPSIPLLNFLSLLLLSITKGSAELFRQLVGHYAAHIKDVGAWDEALESVAEMYFGISRPRQGNPLFDMMGSMFGGGAPAPKKPAPRRVTGLAPGPVAEGLD